MGFGRALVVVVIAMVVGVMRFGVQGAEDKTKELLDRMPTLMVPVIAKVPLALPFIGRLIEGEGCVDKLKIVGKAAQVLEERKKGLEKAEYSKNELNAIICQLGDECAASVLQSLKKAVESMSFIKTMIEKQLPQGVTIDMIVDVGVAYYSQACADVDPIFDDEELLKIAETPAKKVDEVVKKEEEKVETKEVKEEKKEEVKEEETEEKLEEL